MIAVVGTGGEKNDVASSLVLGLRDLGATARAVTFATASEDGVAHLSDSLARSLADAGNELGPLDGIVLASAGAAAAKGDLAGLDHSQWRARLETPLDRTLAFFQGAHRTVRTGGGCLVVVVPTFALVGASGFAPWAAVAEGQRSLAKAAARDWGHQGITVNCVAVPGALLTASAGEREPTGEDVVVPDRPGQPPPALGRSPDLRSVVAPVVLSLVSGRWTGVTGATVAVDGGVWMTP